MSDTIIRVENLGKRYRIGLKEEIHDTFAGALTDFITKPVQNLRRLRRLSTFSEDGRDSEDIIWALKDVSFEVERGQVMGIIGRNGAGKTTLLKILSRITHPTNGRVKINGRISSLLEVGTGFHPELTGQENVYLNGAILGMTKAEIDRKFEEIVEFAGVERFIDTPIKRYSSGMKVRLAFSVAAHLEPEIMLIDEVLAVGDIAFQKKCLGKMDNVAKEGRTVLFVSHDLRAIRRLCSRSILLNRGSIIADGPTKDTVSVYTKMLRQNKVDASTAVMYPSSRRGSGAMRFTSVTAQDAKGVERWEFEAGEPIQFRFSYEVLKKSPDLAIVILLRMGLTNETLTSVRHVISSNELPAGQTGTVVIEFPDPQLRPGEYALYFWLGSATVRPKAERAYDIIDDLTAPLVILPPTEVNDFDSVLSEQPGYFSIPSRIKYSKQW